MKRNKFRRTVNDQLISQVDDEVADDDSDEIAISKDTADYYERRWISRIKEQRGDFWIAVGLYLILSSVAFVVL
ncbi:MAG: hypothetical protein GY783_19980 [Gammaproteobacteria bacterium]|nr:hypothetical protein [Gammaproteobacteria bacterium]